MSSPHHRGTLIGAASAPTDMFRGTSSSVGAEDAASPPERMRQRSTVDGAALASPLVVPSQPRLHASPGLAPAPPAHELGGGFGFGVDVGHGSDARGHDHGATTVAPMMSPMKSVPSPHQAQGAPRDPTAWSHQADGATVASAATVGSGSGGSGGRGGVPTPSLGRVSPGAWSSPSREAQLYELGQMKKSLKKAASCANADRVSEDRRLRTVVSDLARDEAQLRETYADLEAQTAQLAADHTAMLRSRRHVQAQLDAESEELAELRSVQTVLLDKVAAMQQEESRLRLKMQSRVAQLARVEARIASARQQAAAATAPPAAATRSPIQQAAAAAPPAAVPQRRSRATVSGADVAILAAQKDTLLKANTVLRLQSVVRRKLAQLHRSRWSRQMASLQSQLRREREANAQLKQAAASAQAKGRQEALRVRRLRVALADLRKQLAAATGGKDGAKALAKRCQRKGGGDPMEHQVRCGCELVWAMPHSLMCAAVWLWMWLWLRAQQDLELGKKASRTRVHTWSDTQWLPEYNQVRHSHASCRACVCVGLGVAALNPAWCWFLAQAWAKVDVWSRITGNVPAKCVTPGPHAPPGGHALQPTAAPAEPSPSSRLSVRMLASMVGFGKPGAGGGRGDKAQSKAAKDKHRHSFDVTVEHTDLVAASMTRQKQSWASVRWLPTYNKVGNGHPCHAPSPLPHTRCWL